MRQLGTWACTCASTASDHRTNHQPRLKPESFNSLARKKASSLQAQFQRLRHRRGPKKAIRAVAASILTAAYPMLRDGTFYQDLGPDHYRRAAPEAQANRLARQTAKLGFTCTILPVAEREVSV